MIDSWAMMKVKSCRTWLTLFSVPVGSLHLYKAWGIKGEYWDCAKPPEKSHNALVWHKVEEASLWAHRVGCRVGGGGQSGLEDVYSRWWHVLAWLVPRLRGWSASSAGLVGLVQHRAAPCRFCIASLGAAPAAGCVPEPREVCGIGDVHPAQLLWEKVLLSWWWGGHQFLPLGCISAENEGDAHPTNLGVWWCRTVITLSLSDWSMFPRNWMFAWKHQWAPGTVLLSEPLLPHLVQGFLTLWCCRDVLFCK